MPFPIMSEHDFGSGGDQNKKMREAIDYAQAQYQSRIYEREQQRKLYNAYNGIIDEAEIASIVKFTGKQSKTKYVKYRLGRSKLKLLHGEFLMIPLAPQVRTINQEAQNEKMQKYQTALAMAHTKDQLQSVRNMGFDVFPGMEIPDKNNEEIWNPDNFKLTNEIIMQVIIDKFIKNKKIKRDFLLNFIDMTINGRAYGKIEMDMNNRVVYRVINPMNRLVEESAYDPLFKNTPYMGEIRYMYAHEIIQSPEFKLSSEAEKKLLQLAKDGGQYTKEDGIRKINNEYAFPVYTIEFKGFEPVRRKVSYDKDSKVPYYRILSDEYYDKNKKSIEKDIKKGLYEIETAYRQILWRTSKIMTDIYTTAEKVPHLIQIKNDDGRYDVDFNYTGYMFSTSDGEVVSIQELILELEKIYDDIRFQINKELKKLRGDVIAHDDAFIPKGKKFIDVYHGISEDGVMRFNSAAEGNVSGRDMDKQMISSIRLGSGDNLRILVEQAMEVERTMDRITGLNDNRQGLAKATMTATANVNNIEASRSVTYDLFFVMTDFMETVLMKITEKEKLHAIDEETFVFDDNQRRYLKVTKDIAFYNYYTYLSDGRMEQQIRDKLEFNFGAEINAGNLRSSDVAKFLSESSFGKALKILDNANKELAKIRREEIMAGQESKQEEIKANIEMAQEDREDRQEHDKELELLKNEAKKEQIILQKTLEATVNSDAQV